MNIPFFLGGKTPVRSDKTVFLSHCFDPSDPQANASSPNASPSLRIWTRLLIWQGGKGRCWKISIVIVFELFFKYSKYFSLDMRKVR